MNFNHIGCKLIILIILKATITGACYSQTASRDALVTVKNYGAYIAKFTIQYRLNGEWKTEESEYFLAGQTISLHVTQYASRPTLTIYNMIFIAVWRTIYVAEISPWNRICISIGGTTLHPNVQLHC